MRDPAAAVVTGDPIADWLAAGVLSDVDEAEEAYLDQHLAEIVARQPRLGRLDSLR